MNNWKTISIVILSFCLLICRQTLAQDQNIKIGLALSGGGAKGLAHVGVINVLEKAGVKFDYITGTSMGSIIGGLYAIGYSADFIDSICTVSNWDGLINDDIERKNLSFEEKLIYQKYILKLPFKQKKLHLPQGLHEGQCISALLAKLTKHVHNINDFSEFEIPFKCIAANIETGNADILDKGFLAEAIRASMAIPSIFSPSEIDGKLYVDGGLLNNFPVYENKQMGADIVIGVDLQTPFYKKSEIISPLQILDQASKILRSEANKLSKSLCDIIIKPEVTEYSTLEFDDPEEIIRLGEKAARKALPKILDLLDSLGVKHNKRILRNIKPVNYVYLDTLILNGISQQYSKDILKSLKFNFHHKIKYKKIENLVEDLYGTMNFDKVIYKIVDLNGQRTLVFDLKEKNVNDLKLGIRYDTDLKTGLLINYTSNKIFTNKLKLQTNILVSENPFGNIKLLLNPNGLINPILELNAISLQLKLHDQYGQKYNYRSNAISARFALYSNLHHNFRIGTSVKFLSSEIDFKNSGIKLDNPYQNFYNFNLHADLDSWNKTYYPTKGVYMSAIASIIDEPLKKATYSSFLTNFSFQPTIFVTNSFAIRPKIFSGALINDHGENPNWYLFKLGGNFSWKSNQYIPLVGYSFAEMLDINYTILRIDFQYEFYPSNYLIAKVNGMRHDLTIDNMLDLKRDLRWGYGLTYGYNSILGPVEVSISKNNLGKLNFYFTLGFLL